MNACPFCAPLRCWCNFFHHNQPLSVSLLSPFNDALLLHVFLLLDHLTWLTRATNSGMNNYASFTSPNYSWLIVRPIGKHSLIILLTFCLTASLSLPPWTFIFIYLNLYCISSANPERMRFIFTRSMPCEIEPIEWEDHWKHLLSSLRECVLEKDERISSGDRDAVRVRSCRCTLHGWWCSSFRRKKRWQNG